MNPIRTAGLASLVLVTALGTAAHAQSMDLTRAEVKAETLEAIHTGDVAGPGDSGDLLRDRFPSRYPTAPVTEGLTRATVRAELAAAIREGDVPEGDLQVTSREVSPSRFPMEALPQRDPMQASAARR